MVCLFSIDTIKCGRQIVLLFGQETVVVVEQKKRRLLLLKKHFETGMLMSPKKYFYTLSFYGTSSKYYSSTI